MKILVIQLARFGDIYLTWPSLRALRRKYPEAEIHLLVRERFRAAVEGLGSDIQIRTLPTADILKPILSDDGDETCIFKLDEWLETLSSTNWDQIINLSFSPSSSYLTDILAGMKTEVHGYCRHTDGYLSIPDDASAYFYAQVGPDRFNRFHLVDIFAMVAQVDLQPSDWGFIGEHAEPITTSAPPDIYFHLGASQSRKCYPIHHWRTLIEKIAPLGFKICLIGSQDEAPLAAELAGFPNVDNRVGKTSLAELFSAIAKARLLVGADSAPIHIAAHVGTPVLNLSFSSVSFWETGPTSAGSQVLVGLTPQGLAPNRVADAIRAMMAGQPVPDAIATLSGVEGPRFGTEELSFSWRLILALYTNSDYPPLPNDPILISALTRLIEVTDLALAQLVQLKKNPGLSAATEILLSVDVILREVPRLAPAISPLVSWFETERTRIPPGAIENTFARTDGLFQDLRTILSVFSSNREPDFGGLKSDGLNRLKKIEQELPDVARSFRLFQTDVAEPMLQRLLDHLTYFEQNGLHHLDATKVEEVGVKPEIGTAWNKAYGDYHEVLHQLISAFEKRDYVYVADLLEYEIANCVSEWRTQLVKWHDVMLS